MIVASQSLSFDVVTEKSLLRIALNNHQRHRARSDFWADPVSASVSVSRYWSLIVDPAAFKIKKDSLQLLSAVR